MASGSLLEFCTEDCCICEAKSFLGTPNSSKFELEPEFVSAELLLFAPKPPD
uniref:Uncharacterized protein n=1 Tax=Rhizophora mucronata TaxID=61149 RepID=A0A2P2P8X1_RHIMU